MAGVGERCTGLTDCSYQPDNLPRSSVQSPSSNDIADTEVEGILQARASKTTADFYCPLADSLEWIDGPESPVSDNHASLTQGNQPETCAAPKLPSPEEKVVTKSHTLLNGLPIEKPPTTTKHGKSDLRSFLGCAALSFPHSNRKLNTRVSDDNIQDELCEVKVGNSRFYVPSVIPTNNNMTLQLDNKHNFTRVYGSEKPVKPKEHWKLRNGLSLGKNKKCLKVVNISKNQFRRSWPYSDNNRTNSLSNAEIESTVNSNDVKDRVKQVVCRSQSDHSVQTSQNTQLSQSNPNQLFDCRAIRQNNSPDETSSDILICHEVSCDNLQNNKLTNNQLSDNRKEGEKNCVSSIRLNSTGTNSSCVGNCLETNVSDQCSRNNLPGINQSQLSWTNNMQSSTDSSETVEFYDDGVFLEDRAIAGDSEDNYTYCSLCLGNRDSCDSAHHLNRGTRRDSSDQFEHSDSAYNFLEASVSPPGYYKYCDKTKDLDTVFLDSACANSCDNNDDIGDFIETDIPQTAERSSSQSGSRASTSSNDEDNVLCCRDMDHGGSHEHYNEPACWGPDRRFSDNLSPGPAHHPQEADLSKEGVFFSYAPNHNPSLIPGMFRRDTRNNYGRVPAGTPERRQNDLLSDQYMPRFGARPRGRSDSSSIAKQSSSDSEISNLAYSDSSVLISPEYDMFGVELLISNSDVDKVLTGDQGASPSTSNNCNASSANLGCHSGDEVYQDVAVDEQGACFISGAHASGNCCCPNDLSGSSPLQINSHHSNLTSPSAAANSHSLNLRVQFPGSCTNQNDVDEACILTFDRLTLSKSKNHHQNGGHANQNICPPSCRDNRCEFTPHTSQNHTGSFTNNIVEEEHKSRENGSSTALPTTARSHRLRLRSLPGATTDPLVHNAQEASPGDFPLINKATDSLLQNGRVHTSDVQSILSNMLEQKRKQIYNKFGGSVVKVCKQQEDRVMIWNEYEALVLQEKPILSSPCGVMAVLNMLKALHYDVCREDVITTIKSKSRDEDAPVPQYLFSRSVAGTTAEDLIQDVEELTQGAVFGRFFSFYPPRQVNLLKWLSHWIHKGAVPIALLNLQRTCEGGSAIPDAWHHQMIHGITSLGVHLTNPVETVPVDVMMRQLSSESVLLVKRKDILSRSNGPCELHKFFQHSDPRWQTMNVLGQVVNVFREESVARMTGYRAQVTSHVSIPAIYNPGISLFILQNSPHCKELLNCPDLPILNNDTAISLNL